MGHAADGEPLVIGVGNPFRRDDGVGHVVAGRLSRRAGNAMTIMEASGEGATLLEAFERSPWVILIDAIASGAAPGTVLRLDAVADPLPDRLFRYSTHAFGVAEAVELARVLGQLPTCLTIFGVEGAAYETGKGLTPEVEQAAERVVGMILEEVRPTGVHVGSEG